MSHLDGYGKIVFSQSFPVTAELTPHAARLKGLCGKYIFREKVFVFMICFCERNITKIFWPQQNLGETKKGGGHYSQTTCVAEDVTHRQPIPILAARIHDVPAATPDLTFIFLGIPLFVARVCSCLIGRAFSAGDCLARVRPDHQ